MFNLYIKAKRGLWKGKLLFSSRKICLEMILWFLTSDFGGFPGIAFKVYRLQRKILLLSFGFCFPIIIIFSYYLFQKRVNGLSGNFQCKWVLVQLIKHIIYFWYNTSKNGRYSCFSEGRIVRGSSQKCSRYIVVISHEFRRFVDMDILGISFKYLFPHYFCNTFFDFSI